MTRGNARELTLHLIYAREFTGEPPLETVNDRLKEEYFYPIFLKKEIFNLPKEFTIRTDAEE